MKLDIKSATQAGLYNDVSWNIFAQNWNRLLQITRGFHPALMEQLELQYQSVRR